MGDGLAVAGRRVIDQRKMNKKMMRMREHGEAISCRGTSAITAVTRSLMFMLVFCFAGCAAGSCLSYGHSCWGAHGKRSGLHNYPGNNLESQGQRSSLSIGTGKSDAGEPVQDQWILSRLVTRQHTDNPTAEQFRGTWYEPSKARGRGHGHGRIWHSDDAGVASDAVKALRRDEVDIQDDDEEDEIRDETVHGETRILSRETQEQVLEPQDISEEDELVLVPPSENHLKPIGQSHKLRLFKILNGAAGKLE